MENAQKAIDELRYQEKMHSKGVLYQTDSLVIADAVTALELQVPQKPSWEIESNPKHMKYGVKAPFCCVCGQDLLDERNDCFLFCPNCGQKVDWGKTNET